MQLVLVCWYAFWTNQPCRLCEAVQKLGHSHCTQCIVSVFVFWDHKVVTCESFVSQTWFFASSFFVRKRDDKTSVEKLDNRRTGHSVLLCSVRKAMSERNKWQKVAFIDSCGEFYVNFVSAEHPPPLRDFSILYITASKWRLEQGNVFTPVCHSIGEVSAPLYAGIHTPWADTPHPTGYYGIQWTSGRYASYWNVYLFIFFP